MLARNNRFHGYNSLRSVYQRGQTARGGQLSLRYAQRDSSRPYRVAVVVSRKVSKSAVVRNRIRRRVYEVVRTSAFTLQPGTDMIFTVFSDQIALIETEQLTQLINDLLAKSGSMQ